MKPTIQITDEDSNVDWHRVQSLFMEVGWGIRDVGDIELAFSKSTHKVFAFEKDELVGFGRTTDDGVNYALICDLVIAPRLQGFGIGSQLLTHLRDKCSEFRFLTLTAAEGKDEFYLKQGWSRQKSAFIWPRDQ